MVIQTSPASEETHVVAYIHSADFEARWAYPFSVALTEGILFSFFSSAYLHA